MSRPKNMTVKIDRVDELLGQLRTLTKNDVLIGVPKEGAMRPPEPGETTEANNAMIGYINEFGSPANNIPPRPHLIPGVKSAKEKIVAALKKGAARALDGQRGAADQALTAAGFAAEIAVKAKVTAVLQPAPAERTLAERKRKGFMGESPLIVTGAYLRSITHVLRPRKRR